jgi:hypothetical protein
MGVSGLRNGNGWNQEFLSLNGESQVSLDIDRRQIWLSYLQYYDIGDEIATVAPEWSIVGPAPAAGYFSIQTHPTNGRKSFRIQDFSGSQWVIQLSPVFQKTSYLTKPKFRFDFYLDRATNFQPEFDHLLRILFLEGSTAREQIIIDNKDGGVYYGDYATSSHIFIDYIPYDADNVIDFQPISPTQFIIYLNGTAYGPYNLTFGPISTEEYLSNFRFIPEGFSTRYYFNDFQVITDSKGLQKTSLEFLGTESSKNLDPYGIFYAGDDTSDIANIFGWIGDDLYQFVYPFFGPGKVTNTGETRNPPAGLYSHNPIYNPVNFNGDFILYYGNDSIANISQINFFQNFTRIGGPASVSGNGWVSDFFPLDVLSTGFIGAIAREDMGGGVTQIRMEASNVAFPGITSFSPRVTFVGTTGATYNDQSQGVLFNTNQSLVFVADDNDVACIFRWNWNGGTDQLTKIATLTGYHCAGTQYPVLKDANANVLHITVIRNSDGKYVLLRSEDTGVNWEFVDVGEFRFIPDQHVVERKWGYDVDADAIGIFDDGKVHFTPVFVNFGNDAWVAGNDVILDNNGSDIDVYELQIVPAEDVLEMKLENFGTERPSEGYFTVGVEDEALYQPNNFIEFYDGFDQLIIRGKIAQKSFVDGLGFRCAITPLKFEITSDVNKRYKTQTSSYILKDLINDFMSYLRENNTIDPLSDFTTTYSRHVNQSFENFIKTWVREYEEALFYDKPDGLVICHRFDRLVDSGVLINEEFPHFQILESFDEPSIGVTRSRVVGAYNRDGEVYVEKKTLASEVRDGRVDIELSDSKIVNHDEAERMAIKRLDLYSRYTFFVKFRLAGLGFFQPGEGINLKWDDTNLKIDIPLDVYPVMSWLYDGKRDIYEYFEITNNIFTQDEYNGVKVAEERDKKIRGSYSDREEQSVANAPEKYQNPVNKLIAGVYVPRRPAPVQYDWYWDGVTHVPLPAPGGEPNIWNPIDVSSIVPKGARAVHLKVDIDDGVPGNFMLFGEYGLGNVVMSSEARNLVTTGLNPYEFCVPCTENRWIEWLSNINRVAGGPPPVPGWDAYYVVILGWWY